MWCAEPSPITRHGLSLLVSISGHPVPTSAAKKKKMKPHLFHSPHIFFLENFQICSTVSVLPFTFLSTNEAEILQEMGHELDSQFTQPPPLGVDNNLLLCSSRGAVHGCKPVMGLTVPGNKTLWLKFLLLEWFSYNRDHGHSIRPHQDSFWLTPGEKERNKHSRGAGGEEFDLCLPCKLQPCLSQPLSVGFEVKEAVAPGHRRKPTFTIIKSFTAVGTKNRPSSHHRKGRIPFCSHPSYKMEG